MKIAVISDIHDNLHNLELALNKIDELNIKKIICLGDLNSPFVAKILAKYGIPVFMVWGNNEGDRRAITNIAKAEGSRLETAPTDHAIYEVDGKKILLTHYPTLVKDAAASGKYDAVFYGHNHTKFLDKKDDCLVLNPGEIYGTVTGTASFAVYDSEKNEAEIIDLKGSKSVNSEKLSKFLK